jgi:hypothetical protein
MAYDESVRFQSVAVVRAAQDAGHGGFERDP